MAGCFGLDDILRPFRRKRTIKIVEDYIKWNFKPEEEIRQLSSEKLIHDSEESYSEGADIRFSADIEGPELSWYRKELRLDDLLARSSETFSQMVLRLITQKGMKDSDVYNRVNISRQLFSKIRNDMEYQPTKKTVFALAIGMRLNIDEAYDLLARAGYTFSPSKNEDLIVQYFIESEQYDIFQINDVLEHFGQVPLI